MFASKDGYEPVTRPLEIKPGPAVTIPLALVPLPETVQVNTNFSTGTVRIDARRSDDLVNGSFSISGISAGEHVIEVKGSGVDFKARWKSQSGVAPALLDVVDAKDLDATVVSSVGRKGRIASNRNSQAVKIDGTTVGHTVTPENVASAAEISLVGEGVRRLELGDRATFLEVRRNPTLTLLLALDRNVGTLVVETKVSDAKVYLNDRVYGQTTASGVLRLPIDIGKYSVRVAKDGFQASATQIVGLVKGEEKKVTFTLTPMPGVLTLTGLTPGEEITIDGRYRGIAGSPQAVRYDDLRAGEHTIEVVRDGFKPARQNFQIIDGKTTNLDVTTLTLVKKESAPPPPDPGVPDPGMMEARDWERVRSRNTIDELQSFVRQHPGGQHAEEARNLINQLGQAQTREAEEKALREQENAWMAVDKTQRAALQEFITHYGNSRHVQDARTLQNAIEKKETDDLSAQRANEQKAHDQEVIKQTLRKYETAFSEKNIAELQTVWITTSTEAKKVNDQFRNARTFQVKLSLTSPVTVVGDSAAVECARTVTVVPANGPVTKPISNQDRVRITLIRSGSTWLIRAITPL